MNTWKLTTFDQFSLGMVIKGAWMYKEPPEAPALQASLDAVLQPYPQLLGRYDEKQKSVVWTGREVLCPTLEIGSDKPVRVMRLDYAI